MKNEAIHIAILAKALLNKTEIFTAEEALEILKKKIPSMTNFTGRRNLSKEDQIVYWAVYGLEEILETHYTNETELLDNCSLFLN
jgi:hypothetical protein